MQRRARPGASVGATPRSEAIERSPSEPTSETTTPVAPVADRPDELDAVRRELAGDELARSVVTALRDAAGVGAERCRPGGDVRGLPARAGTRLGPDVVPVGERLLEPHDHVEHHISECHDLHWHNRPMDGDDRLGRARSFLIGGLVGASAALATARRSRELARRRRQRLLHPAGLAAFEGAPCYRELIDEEERAED